MRREIAKVIAQLEDPDTVVEVLELASYRNRTSTESKDQPGEETLRGLYDRYLTRRQNRSPSTRAQYRRTIPSFIEFAADAGVTSPDGVSAGLTDRYVDDLQERYDTDSTIVTYTKNVRGWLHWLSKRGKCSESVYRILDKDELGLNPQARDEAFPATEATIILERLRKQRRGSVIHALLELLWNSGLRIGGIHSLDRNDFDPVNNEIRVRHRPETGTRLKNGSENEGAAGDGERNVEVRDSVVDALSDYIRLDRAEVADNYGRSPLFTTEFGRAAKSTLRRKVYQATSCRWAPTEEEQRCDGDCDPDSNVCPYSYYPHAIRRGAIVHHLSGGLRPHFASERFDVSIETIEKHYDPRTKRRRKEDRSDSVRSAWSE